MVVIFASCCHCTVLHLEGFFFLVTIFYLVTLFYELPDSIFDANWFDLFLFLLLSLCIRCWYWQCNLLDDDVCMLITVCSLLVL